MLGLALPTSAYEVRYGYAAQALWEEGLFLGDGTSFALDQPLTRAAGVTMLVRLLGKETEAKAGSYQTPFTDLPDWSKGCIGYAYTNGLTKGTGKTTFSPTGRMNATQFLTLALRALGYDDQAGDFTYAQAADKALEIGLIGESCHTQYTTTDLFLRDNVAVIAYNALSLKVKGTNKTLRSTITVPGRPAGNMPAETAAAAEPTPTQTPDEAPSSGGVQQKTCTACGGTGRIWCSSCGGTGRRTTMRQVCDPISKSFRMETVYEMCPNCTAGFKTCTACSGSGRVYH